MSFGQGRCEVKPLNTCVGRYGSAVLFGPGLKQVRVPMKNEETRGSFGTAGRGIETKFNGVVGAHVCCACGGTAEFDGTSQLNARPLAINAMSRASSEEGTEDQQEVKSGSWWRQGCRARQARTGGNDAAGAEVGPRSKRALLLAGTPVVMRIKVQGGRQ